MNAGPAVSPAPTPTRSRRQRVPPALLRGSEPLQGQVVLDELRDELGLLLFRSLRNVLIWTQLPAQERSSAFAPGAAAARASEMEAVCPPPELLAPLSVIAELLAAPDAVDESRLALACRRVALWAEDAGALGTALDFSQAAALVRPSAAALAYAVGRLARRRAEYDRAESWFARAIIQGRQSRDWRAYATAFSGLGNLHLQRGNFPAARRAHGRCLRAARRHGLRELEGNALHDLSVTAYHAGEHHDAVRFAGQALAAYGAAHHQVPRLAYDVAYNWVLQGRFREALPVAVALLPRFGAAAERLLVMGLICRAAGGAGDEAAFERACGEVDAAGHGEAPPFTYSGALLGAAHGAASLGRWALAEEMATRISAVARERGEGELVIMADSILDAVRRRQRSDVDPQQESASETTVSAEFVSALAVR